MPSLMGTRYAEFGWCPQKGCSLLKGNGRGVSKRERLGMGDRWVERGGTSVRGMYCMREELLKRGGEHYINHRNNRRH